MNFNTSTFYLVRSVEIGEKVEWDWDVLPSKESDFSKMENLIFQEVMSDDNFSNHIYGADTSYAYNNRLHIGGIKTTFFNGFNLGYFQWVNNYNNEVKGTEQVNYYCTEIEIQAGASLEKVYSTYVEMPYFVTTFKMFSSAFLSYPDTRAQRITIYEVNNNVWTKVFTAPLEPHNLLNLAFYMNDGLKPIIGIEDAQEVEENTLSLSNNEMDVIKRALTKYGGKRKLAAQELGISERTLYRKIKEYNL